MMKKARFMYVKESTAALNLNKLYRCPGKLIFRNPIKIKCIA